MVEFMRNGGAAMWVMLVTALGVAAAALGSGRDHRPRILAAGIVAVLAESLLGMSTGLIAVSHAAEHGRDTARLVAAGIGELANNGVLGAALTLALLAGWLVATRPRTVTR